MAQFSDETLRRYSRQILLREVGGRGQTRILQSRAALVVKEGGGAIAAVAAQYLLRAGVAQVRWFAATEQSAEPLRVLQHCEQENAAPEARLDTDAAHTPNAARLIAAPYSARPEALRRAPGSALCVAAWQVDPADPSLYWATASGCVRQTEPPTVHDPVDSATEIEPIPAHHAAYPERLDAVALTLGSALSLGMLQGLLLQTRPAGLFFERC